VGGFPASQGNECDNSWMRPKRLPSAEIEIPGQFTLAESGVNFSVADPMNQGFGFPLASWHQVVFVHTAARFEQPAAEQAIRRH
jgi:hypothetical protein